MMENAVLLKWLLMIGGLVEIFMGIFFVFIHLFVGSMGVSIEVPIFPQLAGCILIVFGYLLIYTTKDVKTYAIIPKMNILLRFIVQPAAIYNIIVVPAFIPILIGAAIYDIAWAILTLILLKKLGYFVKSKAN
jgi:hypothetical protein